jgi:hypothetical protein
MSVVDVECAVLSLNKERDIGSPAIAAFRIRRSSAHTRLIEICPTTMGTALFGALDSCRVESVGTKSKAMSANLDSLLALRDSLGTDRHRRNRNQWMLMFSYWPEVESVVGTVVGSLGGLASAWSWPIAPSCLGHHDGRVRKGR